MSYLNIRQAKQQLISFFSSTLLWSFWQGSIKLFSESISSLWTQFKWLKSPPLITTKTVFSWESFFNLGNSFLTALAQKSYPLIFPSWQMIWKINPPKAVELNVCLKWFPTELPKCLNIYNEIYLVEKMQSYVWTRDKSKAEI